MPHLAISHVIVGGEPNGGTVSLHRPPVLRPRVPQAVQERRRSLRTTRDASKGRASKAPAVITSVVVW